MPALVGGFGNISSESVLYNYLNKILEILYNYNSILLILLNN